MRKERERESIRREENKRKKRIQDWVRNQKRETQTTRERENSLVPSPRMNPRLKESIVFKFLQERIPGVGSNTKLRVV